MGKSHRCSPHSSHEDRVFSAHLTYKLFDKFSFSVYSLQVHSSIWWVKRLISI